MVSGMATHYEIEYREDVGGPWSAIHTFGDPRTEDDLLKHVDIPAIPVTYRNLAKARNNTASLQMRVTDGTEFRVVEVHTIRGRVIE